MEANSTAIHAFITTMLSLASAMCSWIIIEKLNNGTSTLVGTSTGLVAGLVAITPGAGYVSYGSAILMGLLVSPICYFAISRLKHKLQYDDALDAFGCHGVGGIFGLLYGGTHLFGATIAAILITAVWSGIFTFIIIKIIGIFMPIRASDREEAVGMDDSEHKETAYPTFMGLDS